MRAMANKHALKPHRGLLIGSSLWAFKAALILLFMAWGIENASAIPPLAPENSPQPKKTADLRAIPGSEATEEDEDDLTEEDFLGGIFSQGPSNPERAVPGTPQKSPSEPEWKDSNQAAGLEPVVPPNPLTPGLFVPIQDRWRLAKDLNLVNESLIDPYNRNPIKGDRPLFGDDYFFNFIGISDSLLEPRSIPTPVPLQVSSPGLDSNPQLDLNGRQTQLLFNQNLILSFDLYKGDTVFRPPDVEYRITPVINYQYTNVQEYGVVNVDPRRGDNRNIYFVGMQELFADYHLQNVSERYDFDSIRLGIQPINIDFRGFLFLDNQLGVRLFGNRDNNRWQYNVAWFRRLEKNVNNGLNDIGQAPRDDDIYMANLYRQDFPFRGFTSQVAVAYNQNREGNNQAFYDQNGFPSRPALLGTQTGKNYDVAYLGYNGDGHFDRFNLTGSFYYAVGTENKGTFTPQATDINAWFVATEGSIDFDWTRTRLSVLHASGDKNPYDNKAQGFDAIFENPQIAGADTSFWIRQALPLIGGGAVALSGRNAVLPSLRSSKELGQSNFTNPGISLFGFGTDHDILPELRVSTNFNKLLFDNTATLETARNQGNIGSDIGWDLSTAVVYRPLFNQNIVTRLSGATLIPGNGANDLFGPRMMYSVLFDVILTY